MLNMPLVGGQDFATNNLLKLHLPLQGPGVRDISCSDCQGCSIFMAVSRPSSLIKNEMNIYGFQRSLEYSLVNGWPLKSLWYTRSYWIIEQSSRGQ